MEEVTSTAFQNGLNGGAVTIFLAVIGALVFLFVRKKSNTGMAERKTDVKTAIATANEGLKENETKQNETKTGIAETTTKIAESETRTKTVVESVSDEVLTLLSPDKTISTGTVIAELKDASKWKSK